MNPLDNDDYYNLKKICAESFLYSQLKKFKIIRLSNIYGYNYKSPLVLPVFINNAIKIGKIFSLLISFSDKNLPKLPFDPVKITIFFKKNTFNYIFNFFNISLNKIKMTYIEIFKNLIIF